MNGGSNLLIFRFIRTGEHPWEEFQGNGKEELHKGYYYEDEKGNQAKQVGGGAEKLLVLAPCQLLSLHQLPCQLAADLDLGAQQRRAVPIVQHLLPDPRAQGQLSPI